MHVGYRVYRAPGGLGHYLRQRLCFFDPWGLQTTGPKGAISILLVFKTCFASDSFLIDDRSRGPEIMAHVPWMRTRVDCGDQ